MYPYPHHGPSRPRESPPYSNYPGHPPNQYRPSTAPNHYSSYNYAQPSPQMPSSSHPHALRPGFAPSTTHRSDLFFSQPAAPQVNMRPSYSTGPPPAPPPPHQAHQAYNTSQMHHHQPRQNVPPNTNQFHGFPLQRTKTAPPAPPPLPPKPSHHHSLPPNPKLSVHSPHSFPQAQTHSSEPPTSTRQAEGPPDDGDLALALALSQSESARERQLAEKISHQEEEDLARALEESMRFSSPSRTENTLSSMSSPSREKLFRFHSYTPGQTVQASSSFVPSVISEMSSPSGTKSASSITSYTDDEELARSLASQLDEPMGVGLVDTLKDEELARSLADEETSRSPASYNNERRPHQDSSSSMDSVSYSSRLDNTTSLSDDEAFARRLAAEEDLGVGTSSDSSKAFPPPNYTAQDIKIATSPAVDHTAEDEALARKLAAESELPVHRLDPSKLSVSSSSVPSQSTSPSSPYLAPALSNSEPSSSVSSPPQSSLPAYDEVVANGTSMTRSSSHTSVGAPSHSEKKRPSLQHQESNSSVPPDVSTFPQDPLPDLPPPISNMSALRPATADPINQVQTSPTIRPATATGASSSSEGGQTSPAMLPPVNANHFVDADLLKGVSIGFVAPSITQRLAPMQGTFPNIINLPYGRSPPLHLQAPNWRHLLKLMARLSGTRVEPTVEGMAIAKHALHLRTVIQFVKPHHSAPDWRVVLWLKIDHPIPPNLPNTYKYINGDVGTLPYTFTLGSVPTLLHDSDSPISKYYVIPATESLPFPGLPVTFPNLAMYLQAALEESRRFMNDSSSGKRKLAKMLEQCFPNSFKETDTNDGDDYGGVGGLFKRVIGRGNKSRRGGNEDTYELVTPFVADSEEWG